MADNERSGLLNACGLWTRQGSKGTFFAGSMGNISVMVFPNTNKTQENQPDYRLVFAQNTPRPATGDATATSATTKTAVSLPEPTDDDLPF